MIPRDPGVLLFAYGSLQAKTGVRAVDEALKRWTRPLGPAHVRGRLYALGAYPGLKPGAGKVKGSLLLLKDPERALAVLDPYEDYDPRAPRKGEFARAYAEVTPAGKKESVMAHVYFYNRSARGKRRIASGDYLAWLRAENVPTEGLRARGRA